jgi:hypothetical protein
MYERVGVVSDEIPPELVLRFLRDQIAGHRDRSPRLQEGALTFAVSRRETGYTDYWTIFIRPDDVSLERGVAPIQYKGPLVTIYSDEAALSALTRDGVIERIASEGDAALLKSVARCFTDATDVVRLRSRK